MYMSVIRVLNVYVALFPLLAAVVCRMWTQFNSQRLVFLFVNSWTPSFFIFCWCPQSPVVPIDWNMSLLWKSSVVMTTSICTFWHASLQQGMLLMFSSDCFANLTNWSTNVTSHIHTIDIKTEVQFQGNIDATSLRWRIVPFPFSGNWVIYINLRLFFTFLNCLLSFKRFFFMIFFKSFEVSYAHQEFIYLFKKNTVKTVIVVKYYCNLK